MANSSGSAKPIIGVLTASSRKKTKGMIKLAKLNKKAKTTLYFFSRHDVNFDRKRVKGRYYDLDKKSWKNKYFSFPDVLYVRGASGTTAGKLLKRFDKLGIPRVNPITQFNKGELYSVLKKDGNLSPHLPFTKKRR
ncbi:hypothetical protein SD70_15410 [Gordoniibacillus kamchatkensis]|uniref:Uncharacterized protein n=1 Tax=Gordoniibacillus kamchatkensis TaxID=1590651 RepID=A0ABR5AGK8_9BACL|nr:hypothetical protein [Paenibacillus sp. VKM B-2647]KIL40200.1 hypothetical protein SD70_15410 [Paenibacillus sp. VKM B-2647]